MRRENLVARLLRALSGKTQDQLAGEIGVHPSLVAQIELGLLAPRPELLARMAGSAALTLENADDVLRLVEGFQQDRQQGGREVEDLDQLGEELRLHISRIQRRLLTLPVPENLPRPEDREGAGKLFQRLVELDAETALAVVRVAEEFQDWAICERMCEEALKAASCDLERASSLVRLALEIAERVPGPEGWRNRMKGYAAAHEANVLRVAGELKAAEAGLVAARQFWESGSDPGGVLDSGRLALTKYL